MKFSLNWLKELVPFTWSAKELSDRLTMAGVEVENIQIQGQGFEKIVVAQILKSEQHPNADRLSVCEVETGGGKKQIVCGAKNYKVGDKVPLALVGAKLPNGLEIKRSKLRGVESDGMMCSSEELGLPKDTDGLLILSPESKVGMSFTETLGFNDTILDLEITPNRSDLLSHWGLAREIAALADLPPPNPQQLLPEVEETHLSQPSTKSPVPIRVEDPMHCPRYTARIIHDIKVGPSPDWLRRRLESVGQRSISNIVDITNYISQEIGQPLHAFDLKLLKGPEIIVRLAHPGEKINRLDDKTSELKSDMLVIADAHRPVALAGVIGGKETAVSTATTDILLESATFQPASIRKTSKAIGVSTESSYRFERGIDLELAAWASKRATALILEICGGRVDGPLIDLYPKPPATRHIKCRYSKVHSLLGALIFPDEIHSILKRLGCRADNFYQQTASSEIALAEEFKLESCEIQPPSWRLDLKREADLIEEIARVYGIEKIQGKLTLGEPSTAKDSQIFLFTRKLRSLATALGLDEVKNYPLIPSSNLSDHSIPLTNPLSMEMGSLRPWLFTGLLETAARNLAGGNRGVSLFELGKIFYFQDDKTIERPSLGIILTGLQPDGISWKKGVQGMVYDFYDLKGMIDTLLAQLGLDGTQQPILSTDHTILEGNIGFTFLDQNQPVGYAGKVKGNLARSVKISSDVFYAELNVDWLFAAQPITPRYQPWPVYPTIRRDIALTVASELKQQHIQETLYRLAEKYAAPKEIFLQQLELFDIFISDKIGEGKKSLAYSMIYRNPKKTLTDTEINEIHNMIKTKLKDEIPCEIRE